MIILTAYLPSTYVVDLMYGPRKQAVILIPNPLLSYLDKVLRMYVCGLTDYCEKRLKSLRIRTVHTCNYDSRDTTEKYIKLLL